MERIKVKSSNISSIGYDETTKTLEVEFSNGGLYQYKEVPKEVYEGFTKAESIGSYFAKSVRAKGFVYLKIEQKICATCALEVCVGETSFSCGRWRAKEVKK